MYKFMQLLCADNRDSCDIHPLVIVLSILKMKCIKIAAVYGNFIT